jgi:hypothetical protein
MSENIYHYQLSGDDLHSPGYVQSTDPGAVGAGILWVDTSEGTGKWVVKIRNDEDDGWESTDITLSQITWVNLLNKPTSSVAAIDSAVTDSHTHVNQSDLDNVSGINTGDQSAIDFDIKDLTDSLNKMTAWDAKWDYDEDTIKGVKVDNAGNADTVNSLNVETAVPAGAIFTDTTYQASDFDIKDLTDSTNLRTTWNSKLDDITSESIGDLSDVTLTAGKTLTISETTTLAGGTHSGNNTGDQDLSGYAAKNLSIENKTDSYQLVLTDAGKLIEVNHADPKTITIPPSGTVDFPIGTTIGIYQKGAGTVTVDAESSVTLNSLDGATDLTGQYAGATLVKTAQDEWLLTGAIE